MNKCELCEKEQVKLTRHHLVPKSVSNRINPNNRLADKVIRLCDSCHRAIHQNLIDHIFMEKSLSPNNKLDYLKLHILKEYLKNTHKQIWDSFLLHWKQYLKEELKYIDDEEKN